MSNVQRAISLEDMTPGERIRMLRARRRWSQEDLARQAQQELGRPLTRFLVNKMEGDLLPYTHKHFASWVAIAAALGTSAEDLGLSDATFPEMRLLQRMGWDPARIPDPIRWNRKLHPHLRVVSAPTP